MPTDAELWFDAISNLLEDAVFVVTTDGRIERVNQAAEGMFGYSRQELENLSTTALHVDQDQYAEFDRRVQEAFAKGETASFEFECKRKSGEVFSTEHTVSQLLAPGNKPRGIVCVVRDISERRHTQDQQRQALDATLAARALIESEAKFRSLSECSPAGVYMTDLEGGCVFVNDAWCRMAGLSPDEAKGDGWHRSLHPEDREAVFHSWQEFAAGGGAWAHDYRFVDKQGNATWVSGQAAAIEGEDGEILGYVGVNTDISARKQMDTDLLRDRRFLESAQRIGQIGTWELDLVQNILRWTDENYRIFGLPVGTPLTYETFMACIHPDDRAYVDEKWQAGISGEPYDIEHRLVVDGRVKWVRERAEIRHDEQGKPILGIGVTQDITALRESAEALRARERDLHWAQRTAQLGSWTYDPNTGMPSWTEGMFLIWGLDPAQGPPPYSEYSKYIHSDDWERFDAAVQAAVSEGTPYDLELRICRPDGDERTVITSCTPERDDKGAVVRLLGTNQDITDRKWAEETLKESERRFRSMFEKHSSVMLLIEPGGGRIIDANDAATRFYGYAKAELTRLTIQDINQLHLDDVALRRAQAAEGIQNKFVFPHRLSNGVVRTVEVHSSQISHQGKDILFSIVQDVTDRERAITELQASEHLLKDLAANYPDSYMSIIEKDRTVGFTSGQEFKKMNLDSDRFVGLTVEQVFGGDAPFVHQHFDKSFAGEETAFELLVNEQHQSYRTTPLRNPDGEIERILSVALNVTDRKRAEQALRDSEAQHRQAQRVAHIGHWTLDSYDSTPQWSDEVFRIFGADPQVGEPSFTTHDTIIHPDEWPDLDRAIKGGLEHGKPFDLIFKILRPGGEIGWMQAIGEPDIDGDGNVVKMYGTAQDITDRMRAEGELRDRESLYRSVVLNSSALTIVTDPEGIVTYVSPQCERVLGHPGDKFVGHVFPDIIHPDDVARCQEAWAQVAKGGQDISDFEYRIFSAQGESRWISHSANLVRSEDKVLGMQSTITDITESRQADKARQDLEDQLRASQKIEAIGSLAGGVAHDFNNLLSVILSYTGFALEDLSKDDPIRDDLLQVEMAGERAAMLTRQLLAFSRKQILQPVPLDLNKTATDVQRMLQRIIGEDIDLSLVLADNLGLVLADPGQLEQVLMNLVVNARDAMPQGGKLTIETSNVEIDEECAADHEAVSPAPFVQITVTDTGCGMDEQTQARLFEPFFTTKERGKGTGLGLPTAYGIVKQSGGNIWVYSEPGMGTTLVIHLPRDLAATAAIARSPGMATLVPGTETILIVEDEEALLEVARRSLEAAGYTVLSALAGDEALTIAAQHAGEIQLLLTDVIMPQMSGPALAQELVRARPQLEVLYMSGYTDDAIVHHGMLEAETQFISKPFVGADLARKVRQVLDDRFDTADR